MDALIRAWTQHGTKILGFLGVTVGVLAISPDVIPRTWLPWITLANGLLVAWRGVVNSWNLPRA